MSSDKISVADQLLLIQQAKNYLKKDPTMLEMCQEHNVDINDIDLIPVKFDHIDVSAITEHGIVILNYKLLENDEFMNNIHYLVHEFKHYWDQSEKPTRSANDGPYLANKDELNAFQPQIKFISDHEGKEKAEQYVEQVLDHHDEHGKERAETKDVLMEKVERLFTSSLNKLSFDMEK